MATETLSAPAGQTKLDRELVRKLHRWELDHLREFVEEQRRQIEALTTENERLTRERDHADDCAEMWRQDALRAIKDSGAQPGLTIDGHLVAVLCPDLLSVCIGLLHIAETGVTSLGSIRAARTAIAKATESHEINGRLGSRFAAGAPPDSTVHRRRRLAQPNCS